MTHRPPPAFTKTCHHSPYPAISPSNASLSAKGNAIVITRGGTRIRKATATATAFIEANAKSCNTHQPN